MAEERVTVYKPPGPISFVNVRETVRYRTLIARLAARDITLRYRQTLLGVVWVIVRSLLAAGAVALVFGGVANLSAGGDVSYFLLAFAGTVWWTATSQTVIRVTGSLVALCSARHQSVLPSVGDSYWARPSPAGWTSPSA